MTLRARGPRLRRPRVATVAWTQVLRGRDVVPVVVPRIAVSTSGHRLGARRDLLRSGTVSGAAASGRTTLVAVTGSRSAARLTRDEHLRPDDVGGVVVRSGSGSFGPLRPVGRASVVGGPEVGLAGGPAGLRAVWGRRVAVRVH